MGLVVCVLVALADEIHQATVPLRAFRLEDIGIDVVGALAGVAMVHQLRRDRSR